MSQWNRDRVADFLKYNIGISDREVERALRPELWSKDYPCPPAEQWRRHEALCILRCHTGMTERELQDVLYPDYYYPCPPVERRKQDEVISPDDPRLSRRACLRRQGE